MTEEIEEKITEYRNQGFNDDQIHEIEEGLKAGIDVSRYNRKNLYAIQMHQIRLGLLSGVDVEIYRNPEYDWFQMEEIRLGLEEGLDVLLYAKKEFPFETMREIRQGLEEGIHLEKYAKLDAGLLREIRLANADRVNIIPYIKEGYIPEQLEQIRYALKNKLQIDDYLSVWFRGEAIHQIILGLEEGLNVSLYADISFDWHQMEEIRLGLEHRIDASRYAKKLAGWRQMHEIRLGLEEGLDVSEYESVMYPGREMCRRRGLLKKKASVNKESAQPDTEWKSENEYDEVNTDNFKVTVTDNGLSGFIDVGTESLRISPDALIKCLKAGKVINGYQWNVIALLGTGQITGKTLIASGKKAIDGSDGYYEYLLEGKAAYQPVYNDDGSIDFGKSIWYKTVDKGEQLVKYHPAVSSIPGATVEGKSIRGYDGIEKPPLSGKGFRILEDGITYVSDIDGVITYDAEEYSLKVVPLLVVESLNANSNTIIFDGTVHVRGQIENNTYINAGGDVFADGFVGDASINAVGSIILRKGMRGSGSGILKAGKDIDGNFFEHVTMEAGDEIRANYCLNCTMSAGDKITVLGKQGYIGGGIAVAGSLIRTSNVGNRMNIRTRLVVGIKDELYEQEKELKRQKKENEGQLKILGNALEEFYLKYSPEARNANQMFIKIEDAVYTKTEQQRAIDIELNNLKNKMEAMKQARVIVEGTLYEGSEISINNAVLKTGTMSRIVYRYIDGNVVPAAFKGSD